jgi:uncharacterized protein (DUF1800 family)
MLKISFRLAFLGALILSHVDGIAQGTTSVDAFRLLQQASFGPTENSIKEVSTKGVRAWLSEQMSMPASQFSGRDRDQIHKWSPTYGYDYCRSLPANTAERDSCSDRYLSPSPVRRDFFKNASRGSDQLRQRMAFALSQILVISEQDLPGAGTYGWAEYFQILQDNALGNYFDLLRSMTLNPMMGRYLNLVNNDKQAPNENFARELLQLFSIGTCLLNPDGTLQNAACTPTFDNKVVKEYAQALAGYTWPAGGYIPGELYGWNPQYLRGAMVPVEKYRDSLQRQLLSNTALPAKSTASAAMDAVISSIEKHPNVAPFVSKQLIQFLVSSNPSSGFVLRVSKAFNDGKYEQYGGGRKGDLKAVVAAILLDDEARNMKFALLPTSGMLKDPILRYLGAVRALNGVTDGEEMGISWRSTGLTTEQPFLNSPTVFGFYRPDYALQAQSQLVAPQFQLISPNSVLGWTNFVDDLLYTWHNNGNGLASKPNIAEAIGTRLNFSDFLNDANDPEKLVARLGFLLTGNLLSEPEKKVVIAAVKQVINVPNKQNSVQLDRVRVASYLLLTSSSFQVMR